MSTNLINCCAISVTSSSGQSSNDFSFRITSSISSVVMNGISDNLDFGVGFVFSSSESLSRSRPFDPFFFKDFVLTSLPWVPEILLVLPLPAEDLNK